MPVRLIVIKDMSLRRKTHIKSGAGGVVAEYVKEPTSACILRRTRDAVKSLFVLLFVVLAGYWAFIPHSQPE